MRNRIERMDRAELLPLLQERATHSSHFVWLLSDLSFVRTSNGWVFAVRESGSVAVVALEPLVPPEHLANGAVLAAELESAWGDLRESGPELFLFAGIYRSFFDKLARLGFSGIEAGTEPWASTDEPIPRGNRGKGVRAARNQAIRAGVRAEEWGQAELRSDRGEQLRELIREWRSSRPVHLDGFLNATCAFSYPELRRYFIAVSSRGIEGYLIASPIGRRDACFLEDLIYRRDCPNGVGELLTSHALAELSKAGIRECSLGIISKLGEAEGGEGLVARCARGLVRALDAVYNQKGIELYRKRFKPTKWDSTHLALGRSDGASPGVRDWALAGFALLRAFEPRLALSRAWLSWKAFGLARKRGISFGIAGAMLAIFAFVNRFGALPDRVFHAFAFTPSAPPWQWAYRSLASDFLYAGPAQFVSVVLPLFLLLRWAEGAYRRPVLVPLLAALFLFDDWVNSWMLFFPFPIANRQVMEHLIARKDVGGSLELLFLLGMRVFHLRKLREPAFAAVSVAILVAAAMSSAHFHFLLLKINYAILFAAGYLTAAACREVERRRSRAVCKGEALAPA